MTVSMRYKTLHFWQRIIIFFGSGLCKSHGYVCIMMQYEVVCYEPAQYEVMHRDIPNCTV